ELVAAFLHGDEGADAARAYRRAARRPQDIELVLDRKFRVDDRALALGAGEQTGQAMVALRAHDEIDHRRAADDFLTFGLGDAARNGNGQAASVARGSGFKRAHAAELGIDLVGGFLADVTGIEDDEIGILDVGGLREALGHEHVRHTMGIVDVHLAAEGFDVELARSGHARWRRVAAQVPQRFDAPRKSRATGERPMVRFLPALTPKANGCGLFHSLLRSTDVGVLDDLRPLGDFDLDIAIERIG